MADDKNAREKQARDADRRQRERDVDAERRRMDEPEPAPPAELADLETTLESIEFPATGDEVVAAVGDHEVAAPQGTYPVADLVPETDAETFDAPAAVRAQVERPTVAGAMKRVLEAAGPLQNETLRGSQRKAYERTFTELAAIDPVDEDEAIRTIADWIVERIDEKGTLPGSRGVRRQAAKVCRERGYQVRNDEWLGV